MSIYITPADIILLSKIILNNLFENVFPNGYLKNKLCVFLYTPLDKVLSSKMSIYPPPSQFLSQFNNTDYTEYLTNLDVASADLRYCKLTGSIISGVCTFSAGLFTDRIFDSGNTFSVPSSSGQLALTSDIPSLGNYVDLSSAQSITGLKTFSTNPLFSNGSLSLPSSSGTIALLSDITTPSGLSMVDGSESSPSLNFISDTNTGIYRIGNDNIGISLGGVKEIDISQTRLETISPIYLPDGAQSSPSLAFSGDTYTGFWKTTGEGIGISCGTVTNNSWLRVQGFNTPTNGVILKNGPESQQISFDGANDRIDIDAGTIRITSGNDLVLNNGNAISDLEENTWTPSFSNTSNINSISNVVARYVRCNDTITCYLTVDIQLTTASTYSFDFTTPFSTTNNQAGIGRIQRNNNTSISNSGQVAGDVSSTTKAAVIGESTASSLQSYNLFYIYNLAGNS